MTLRLRNTLTRSVEPVLPLDGATVRMYTCGPTVYRYAHVGNLRTFLLADLIRRALLYHGLEVRHVQNITDVGHMRDERFDRGEDRMLVAAGLENKTPAQIADAYEAAFHADEAAVNILPAHVFPRATEHIPEMVELAERLVDAGFAYETPIGNVYYSVASFPDYGRLSGNTLDDLRAGHRGAIEPDKRDPADFALWKSAGEGRLLKWPTPRWGDGFPGWHLECSAMAMRHLGPRFDIHTGGIDNVFPHHEGEIAQSAPIVGGPPARIWVHGEFLQVGGQKMAKSAGNIERVTELADRGIDPLAFRYLALTSRYRHKLEYTDESIGAAAAGLESLRSRLRALGPPPPEGPWAAPPVLEAAPAGDRPAGTADGAAGHGTTPDAASWTPSDRAHTPVTPLSPTGRDLHDRFSAAVDDDLDLPTALAVVREALGTRDLPGEERRWLTLDADLVLGLRLHRVWAADEAPVPDEIARLVRARDEARDRRDFGTADRIRDNLADRGWQVVDGPDGSRVTRGA
ncbi:MAG TPA: cysteine--tRNA ligase [Candidatus Limnocylindrales bacterium]|nr:cysteine--tRNA ligase [Candidatus Limnocylindrales bacterium]